MTDDQRRIQEELTVLFCQYLQAIERPPVTAEEFNSQKERSITRFRNDPVFHAKVNQITAHVLKIVEGL